MDVSVVIPVYGAAERLPALVGRLLPVMESTGLNYEIVFVDDGSRDDSWKVLSQLRAAHTCRIAAIQLMRNYGQHNALMAGFRRARGYYVVTMDDDLQHPPEEIPKLLDTIRSQELDLVYGCYYRKKHGASRNLGASLVHAFYRLAFRSRVTITAFRVIRRELLESIFQYSLNFTFVDGLLAWNTQRIGEVIVDHHERAGGRSGYTLPKLAALALNLVTNFSLLPLQVATLLGLFTAGSGVIVAIYYLVLYFLAKIEVQGYTSTIIAILVLGGVQLIALGIIGEYLGRIHLNINRKPQYVERQVLGPSDGVEAQKPS